VHTKTSENRQMRGGLQKIVTHITETVLY